MSQVLDDLLSLLTLEEIEQGLYRGQSQDLGFGAVFGGQKRYQRGVLYIHSTLTFYAQAMPLSLLCMM